MSNPQHADRPTPRHRILVRTLLLAASLTIALLTAECVVRLTGRVDGDGNFFFRGQQVGRRYPPVAGVAETLQRYRTSDETRMVYDAQTGWKPRPHDSSHAGQYRYNAAGIRSAPREYNLQPAEGTLRIALFGDSFTHGDDVPFEKTWGALLESLLNKRGIPAEVINFGVSAYGMDQAFLRWQTLGKSYSPRVVLFGFQAENVNRNVNLLRAFYAGGTGIPFSKPRFILADDGRLRLINSPTLPLERIPGVMADMQSWELSDYEMFDDPSRYESRCWHVSRLASLAVESFSPRAPRRRFDPFRLGSEPARITLALLDEFRRDVESRGARFLIVHLPTESDLARKLKDRSFAYRELLDRIAQKQTLIDPQHELLAAARAESLDSLFQRHYSPNGNRIIAEAIAAKLASAALSDMTPEGSQPLAGD